MFKVSILKNSDFEKIILKDTTTNTSAEIIPSCGAILHAFTIIKNSQTINVIDSYLNTTDFKINAESKGFKGCKLSPFVCRLKNARYNFGQNKFTIQKFLLGKNAIHGLLYNVAFTTINTWANEQSAGACLQYQYNASDKGYPFKYTCTIKYELKNKNNLSITTTITNNDDTAIPMQDGWHPYFTFGNNINNLQLKFKSKEILEFDDELLPTGKLIPYQDFALLKKINDVAFDNCFTVNFAQHQPLCTLRDVQKKLQIEIYPSKAYPYLQIYTPPHRNSIAIENLSGAPDAFNNGMGMQILSPNQTASFTTTYKITSLS